MAQTQEALARIAELVPEFEREFKWRKVVALRDQSCPPGTLTVEQFEAWFRARGVRVRLRLDGSMLALDGVAELVESSGIPG